MKVFFCIFLLFLSSSHLVIAKDFHIEKLRLKANIERSKFFSYSIDKMYFDKNKHSVKYDDKQKKFEDVNAKLSIITNVPSVMTNVGYFIELTTEESKCEKLGVPGPIEAESFTHYSISGNPLEINKAIEFDKFNSSTDGYYSDSLDLKITFDELDEAIAKTKQCYGSATFITGLNL